MGKLNHKANGAFHITTVAQSLGFIRGQVGYLQHKGFDIHVVSSPSAQLVDFGSSQQLEPHAVEMPRKVSPIHDLSAVRQLVRMLRTLRPIIVHAHTPKAGLLGMISARIAHVPIRVYHIRGLLYMTSTGRRRILLKTTEPISCKLAHKVFCVSHTIRDVALRDGICPAEKIVVFGGASGNGVDSTDRFNPAQFSRAERNAMRQRFGIHDNALVIAFVGRIVRDKGVEDLVTAWSSIRKSYPLARLVFMGPLDDADLFILASRSEGLPRAKIEAMARGLPCIGTTVGGIPKLMLTEDMVRTNDPAALAEKIREVVTDSGRLCQMATRNLDAAHDCHSDFLEQRRFAIFTHLKEQTEEWLMK